MVRRLSQKLPSDSSKPRIEEQSLFFYDRKQYYPVKIGELFKDRYRIIAKLGYGAYSTVWLARDERLVPGQQRTELG